MKTYFTSCITGILLLLTHSAVGQNPNAGLKAYEGSFLFVDNHPDNGTPSWGDDDNLTNGVTHDDSNWYFTSLSSDIFGFPDNSWVITRIPVTEDLDQDFSDNQAVLTRHLEEVDSLFNNRYGHAGDLDNFRHNGIDYLFIPLTNSPILDSLNHPIPGTELPPAIAVFRADDLTFLNYAFLIGQHDVGWCAVHPKNGYLYTSTDDAEAIIRYQINWDTILNQPGNHYGLSMTDQYPLTDIVGNQPFKLYSMQGGEFSPNGELLFVSCGIFVDQYPTDGLHVFNVNNWQEIQRSFNGGFTCCPPYFRFAFDNSFDGGDEPEGLTYWDVDNLNAPNVSGQLHVILYIHNYLQSNTVKLKHYTRQIFVDPAAPATPLHGEPVPFPQPGTAARPFNNLHDVLNYYGAWDGAEIVFKPGSYPATETINVRVKLTSQGGTAIIGQ